MWKYDAASPEQRKLLENGIIDLGGEVDEQMVRYVREALMYLRATGNPPIEIFITSDGGHVNIGLDVYDFLKDYPGKKIGKVIGFSRSIATIILQACDERQSSRHAKMLIHHVYRDISLDVIRSPEKLIACAEQMEADQKRLNTILVSKTGKSEAEIAKISQENRDLSAEEALALGLIDIISDEASGT